MLEVDLSKIINVKVVPSKDNDFGLVQERACRECALGPSRKGESKTYPNKEVMNYCVGCLADAKHSYERGKPFEIGIVMHGKYLGNQEPESKVKSEGIPPAPEGIFLFHRE